MRAHELKYLLMNMWPISEVFSVSLIKQGYEQDGPRIRILLLQFSFYDVLRSNRSHSFVLSGYNYVHVRADSSLYAKLFQI